MKLSIIVPVYNEEETISQVLEKLLQLEIEKEIIVVNDGSVDRTQHEIENIKKRFAEVKCIRLDRNLGKGRAIREGVEAAEGEIIAIQDADLEYEPEELVRLVGLLKEGEIEVAYGVRFKVGSKSPFWHRLVNKFLSWLTSLLYFKKMEDMETCYKVMYREVWEKLALKSKRFEVEAEITAKLLRKKFKIVQSPISYNFRSYREGKKISWSDGLRTILALFRYRFTY